LFQGGSIYFELEAEGRKGDEGRFQGKRKFLALSNGIPDKDMFRRLFERLGPDCGGGGGRKPLYGPEITVPRGPSKFSSAAPAGNLFSLSAKNK
jgi:hypothetical protein